MHSNGHATSHVQDQCTLPVCHHAVELLAVLQPLHGLTFALLHLACMRVIGNVVPPQVAATAQTLYADHGGLAFLPMAVLCVIALPVAWWGFAPGRRQPGGMRAL